MKQNTETETHEGHLTINRLIDCVVIETAPPVEELTSHYTVVTDDTTVSEYHFRAVRPDDGRGCAVIITGEEAH